MTAFTQLGLNIVGEGEHDNSGYAVSLSSDGTVVAIGAPANGGSDRGHTRIYAWDGSAWVQRGIDIDGTRRDGNSVSLSADGSTVAIGAKDNSEIADSAGRTRIYDWSGTAWVQRGSDLVEVPSGIRTAYPSLSQRRKYCCSKIAAATRIYAWNGSAWCNMSDIDEVADGDYGGWSVSLSSDGSIVAIGAINHDRRGHTRIYAWNGSAWVQRGSDIDGDTHSTSGYSVSLSSDGSVVAIGQPNYNTSQGLTRIYAWDGSAWVERGSGIEGDATFHESGKSVALSGNGNTLVIGAPLDGSNDGTDSGTTRIYTWDGSSWNQFGTDIDGETGVPTFWDYSEHVSLSSDGSTVAIGATKGLDATGTVKGNVRVFRLADLTAPTFSSAATNADGTGLSSPTTGALCNNGSHN